MKNKQCCSVKCTLSKDVLSAGNSIIHCLISMLLTSICGTMAGTAAIWIDGGAGYVNVQAEVAV